MTAIAVPAPWVFPDWIKKGLLGLVGLSLMFTVATSNFFRVDVEQNPVISAFPGCQGFGCATTHGRGGAVVIVTNTNDSGAGSLRAALEQIGARIVIFRVSGTIALLTKIELLAANSFVYVAGQTAPGDGITIKGPDNDQSLHIGNSALGSVHDIVFRHIRWRHGSPTPSNSPNNDNMAIFGGSFNVIFDHNSFTWAGDEVISIVFGNAHDITLSHNLFAEGVVFCREGGGFEGQNVGPLFSLGNPQYKITFHHNLLEHMCFRNFLASAGAAGNSGYQSINNVHYNNSSQEYGFAQNQYTGTTAIAVDVIADYFKHGPIAQGSQPQPFLVARDGPGTFVPISLYLVDSTWRNNDGTAHIFNNESNNYAMLVVVVDFGFGVGTWEIRASPFTAQPTFPVTETSAAQAYIDVVINEDVGATKPKFDSVDRRLVDDPEDSGVWSLVNVPAPRGSASYPVMSTFNVPTDTDNDGVPDDYETNVLGTNPNIFENQAVLDHNGNGFTNIEEWIESL